MLTKEVKQGIMEKYRQNEHDSGSSDVQVALLTERIKSLTEHFKAHKKDTNSRRGLLVMVGRRRGLLKYLQKTDIKRYRALIEKLELRK